MIDEKKSLNRDDWTTILFHPERLHFKWISNLESVGGNEIISYFQGAYRILQRALAIAIQENWPEHKRKALIPLVDGFSSLVCVVNVSNLGFAVEASLILRYYLEAMGLSYGIFHDPILYQEWKTNPKKKYANRFTKRGLDMLSQKYSHFKDMWATYSEMSHFTYSSTGSAVLPSNSVAVSGAHSENRNKVIEWNIKAAEILVAVTAKMILSEYLDQGLTEEERKIVEGG